MSIFTTRPTPLGQTTSQTFIEYGCHNQIPTPVGESNVSAIAVNSSLCYSVFANNIASAVASGILERKVDIRLPINAINPAYVNTLSNLLPSIDLAVSFQGRELAEKTESSLVAMGFRKESFSRQAYYRGQGRLNSFEDLIQLGASMETRSPYGATNMKGFLTMKTMATFLDVAIRAFRDPISPGELYGVSFGEDGGASLEVKLHSQCYFKKVVPKAGHLLPYFDGMLLPDRGAMMRLFLKYFSKALGKTQAQIAENSALLRFGWQSLANSPTGLVLSHIIFCFDLAMTSGMRPIIYAIGSSYGGTFLSGDEPRVMKANTLVPVIESRAEVQAALDKVNSHIGALTRIAAILSEVAVTGEKVTTKLDAADIANARDLRGLIQERTLSTEQVTDIRKSIQLLKFSQTYWDPADHEKIILVIKLSLAKKELPDSAPIAYRTDALFAKDVWYSNLSAFGIQAPTLQGRGNSVVFPISTRPFYRERVKEGKELEGIPIFILPLQQAVESWQDIRKTAVISFNIAGKTARNGKAKVPGVRTYIPFDSNKSNELQSHLGKALAPSRKTEESKKRSREQREEDEDKSENAAKKRKRAGISDGFSILADFGLRETESMIED